MPPLVAAALMAILHIAADILVQALPMVLAADCLDRLVLPLVGEDFRFMSLPNQSGTQKELAIAREFGDD
jgi:hypothetical protein